MSFVFYRKERPAAFNLRFHRPTASSRFYRLQSDTIFQAKNFAGQKRFIVPFGGQMRKLIATVQGMELLITSQPEDIRPHVTLRMSDANMHDALTQDVAGRNGSLLYQVAKKLCKDHATSSESSPLISGCIVNNFQRSLTYDGFKLVLTLKTRKPFQNPFVSGLEKEYFLIGRVLGSECSLIKFLGRTHESCNELVNLPGSNIPRPSATYNRPMDLTGSQIPRSA